MAKRLIFTIFLCGLAALSVSSAPRKQITDRTISAMGVRCKLTVRAVDRDHFLIQVRTRLTTSADTVRADAILPVLVNEAKSAFYFGRFGGSQYPMLIVAFSDPDRIQDSRIIAYQVTKEGTLIGQKVVPERSLEHGYTTSTSGGRFDLFSLNPQMGTIHSISYHEARFQDYMLAFEKLRVRQWEPSIDGFLEVDYGFLRDKRGRLVESTKFRQMSEIAQQRLFVSNVVPPMPTVAKVQPVLKPVRAGSQSAKVGP